MRPIDADALSEKLCKTTIFIKDGEVFQRMINDAPTVSAEAVQREWTITLTDDGFGGENTHLICSVCGSEPLAWSSRKFFRYCPSCGAKMGGGDSE